MKTRLSFTNLEQDPSQWIAQIGPNINPVPSDAVEVSIVRSGPLAGSMRVVWANKTAVGSALPGALITRKLDPPVTHGGIVLPYIKLSLDVFVTATDLGELMRFENDVKIAWPGISATTPTSPVYDFSTQGNASEGGMWQIDKAGGGWLDTGIDPLMPLPDVWTHFDIYCYMDVPNLKFSVLSAGINGTVQSVPSTIQEVPCLTATWAAVTAVQLQAEGLDSFEMFYRNVNVDASGASF